MNEMTTVSFPGLGIEKLEFSKIAFTLFGKVEVRWYGLILTAGIVIAFLYTIWRGKRNENVKSDDIIDIGIFTVLFGILGARLYYVLTTLDTHQYNSFLDVIAIWNGGIAVYGSIIGGGLAIVGVCLWKKISWCKLFDMVAPGLIIAQSVGRWGNFCNGEAHGSLITGTTQLDLFGNVIELPAGGGTFFDTVRMGLYENGRWNYYHPTFLYESVWNLIGFVLLNLVYKHKKFHGQIALMYFAWYGLGRMFIEGFRTDSLYIPGTTLRISQCVGLLCLIAAGVMLIVFLILNRGNKPFEVEAAAVAEGGDGQAKDTPVWQNKIENLWSRAIERVLGKKAEEKPEMQDTEKEELLDEVAKPLDEDPNSENNEAEKENEEHGNEN